MFSYWDWGLLEYPDSGVKTKGGEGEGEDTL